MSDHKDPFRFTEGPEKLCEEHGLLACVVVVQLPDGSFSMAAHGMNHFAVNHALSLGIHMNLTDHDRQVIAGAAGPEAQAFAREIQKQNEVH